MSTLTADTESPSSITLDVIARCECCSFTDVNWKGFLIEYVDHVPEAGSTFALRVTVKQKKRKSSLASQLSRVLEELAARGHVSLEDGSFKAIGLLLNKCATDH